MLVSSNMYEYISDVSVIHDMDNISDHSVISVSFDISVEYAHIVVQNEAKLLWTSATAADIDEYKHNIDRALDSITLDPEFLYCTDHKCSVHMDAIASLYDSIVMCCLDAGKCIPTKKFVNKKCNKAIPGWKEHMDPTGQMPCFGMLFGRILVPPHQDMSLTLGGERVINIIMLSERSNGMKNKYVPLGWHKM